MCGEPAKVNYEGGVFANPSAETLEQLKIEGGAQLLSLEPGKWQEAGLQEGFVITAIDKTTITSAQQLMEVMDEKQGGILIEGYGPDGDKAFYGYGW